MNKATVTPLTVRVHSLIDNQPVHKHPIGCHRSPDPRQDHRSSCAYPQCPSCTQDPAALRTLRCGRKTHRERPGGPRTPRGTDRARERPRGTDRDREPPGTQLEVQQTGTTSRQQSRLSPFVSPAATSQEMLPKHFKPREQPQKHCPGDS